MLLRILKVRYLGRFLNYLEMFRFRLRKVDIRGTMEMRGTCVAYLARVDKFWMCTWHIRTCYGVRQRTDLSFSRYGSQLLNACGRA